MWRLVSMVVLASTTAFAADQAADAKRFFDQGRAAMQNDEDDRAVRLFEKAVELQPRSAQYHFWLGRAVGEQAMEANKLRQALLAKKVQTEFETAVKLDPSYIDARFGLIDFYLMAPGFMGGGREKANEQVAAIRKIDPLRGVAAAARLHRHDKRDDLIEKEYLAAAAAHPQRALPRIWLSTWYANKNDFDRAFQYVDAAIQAEPGYVPSQFYLGRAAALSGKQFERGEAALKKYLSHTPKEDEPNIASAHYRLGQIYEKSGRKDLARQYYLEAKRTFGDWKELADAIKRVS